MTGGTVVVLGPTGRNFAAGMSGGVAYVYDSGQAVDGQPQRRDGGSGRTGSGRSAELRSLIEKHVAATDSAVGQRILADWSGHSDSFVKVMPRDYRRVLEAIADAELTGGDVNEAIMAAARG